MRSKPVLAVLDDLPAGYRLVGESELGGEPLIDLTLPIVGRIAIPRRTPTPVGFDLKVTAGMIVNEKLGVLSTKQYQGSWEIRGERFDFFRSEMAQIQCPRVYGSQSVVATLTLEGHPPIRVRLPATGTPEPVANRVPLHLSSGELTCIPRPIVSPQFPIRYDLAFKGKGVSFLMVRPKAMSQGYFLSYLPIWPGLEGRQLHVRAGHPTESLLIEETWASRLVKVRIKLGRFLKPPLDMALIGTRATPNLELTALDGSFVARAIVYERDGQAFVNSVKVDSKSSVYLGDGILQIGDTWLGYTAQNLIAPQVMQFLNEPIPKWSNGQVVEMRLYSQNDFTAAEQDFPDQLTETSVRQSVSSE